MNTPPSNRPKRLLIPGVYVPTVIFFDRETEDLNIPSIKQHTTQLARSGVAGIVANGSNGEAVHLSRDERSTVTRATREALDESGFVSAPVIVGASEQSVRGSIQLCRDVKEAGGDYVLLMPPSFYKWAATRPAVLHEYFLRLADESPLPVILYNFPAAVAGVDVDSDMMIELLGHPNIVGVKFTCGNNGKLARVARAVNGLSNDGNVERKPKMLFAGIADFLTPALSVGGAGVIAGGANVFPKTCVQAYSLFKDGKTDEANALQLDIAEADWALTKLNFPGAKAVLEHYHEFSGMPRQPIPRPTDTELTDILDKLKPILEYENSAPNPR